MLFSSQIRLFSGYTDYLLDLSVAYREFLDEDDAYAVPGRDMNVHIRPDTQVYDITLVRGDIYRYLSAIRIMRAVSNAYLTGSTYRTRVWP
jgi:hypothetical protein